MEPVQQYSVFISHATRDKEFVERLNAFLESIGVRTWVDNYEIRGGESIPQEIVDGIYSHDYFCLILTQKAYESKWVLRELQMAICRWVDDLRMSRSFILPILREDCQVWDGIKDLHYMDFREDTLFPSRCKEIQDAILKPDTSEFYLGQRAFVPSPQRIVGYKNALAGQLGVEGVRYIPRRLLTVSQRQDFPFLHAADNPLRLHDVIYRKRLITLLGDAGTGKSVELKMAARKLAASNAVLIPVFASLNQYVDHSIEQYVPLLAQFPDEVTVLILDGFDEIQAQHKNTAVRRIEYYAEHHPLCRIVLSSRSNLYQTIAGFDQFWLAELTGEDARDFIAHELGHSAKRFESEVWKKDYHTLLTHPFYLHLMVDIFRNTKSLPQRRAELFEYFVQSKLDVDLQKFRTTVGDIREWKQATRRALERLALIMETLGRNFLAEDEYRKILSEDLDRDVLLHSGLMKRSGGDSISWQFEHDSFQEYLAAKALSGQSLDTIKNFVAFGPDFHRTKPSWLNTISFLLSIVADKQDLFDGLVSWLREVDSEVLLKGEPDRIGSQIRVTIFKNIFEDLKCKRIPIGRDGFSAKDIGQFADLPESVDYLMDTMSSETDPTVLDNAVYVLRFMNIPYSRQSECEDLLLKIVTASGTEPHLVSSSVLTLADLHFNSAVTVRTVVAALKSSDNTWIRFALYYYLYTSQFLDENIDVFLDGLQYIRSEMALHWGKQRDDIRLGDESYHLEQGLKRAKSATAMTKIIRHFASHPEDFRHTFVTDGLDALVTNASAAFREDRRLYEAVADLFIALVSTHQDKEILAWLRFFDMTGTRTSLFNKLFARRVSDKDWYVAVGAVLNEELAELIAQAYLDREISDHDVWVVRNFVLWKNENRTDWFIEAVNRKAGNKFVLPVRRDYEAEREARFHSDLQLLFDQDAFLRAIRLIYDQEGRNVLGEDDLHQLRLKRWDDPYFSELALRELDNLTKGHPRSFEEVRDTILKSDWDYVRAFKLHQFMSQGRKFQLAQSQSEIMKKWTLDNLGRVNFRTALRASKSGGAAADQLALILWYFIRHLDLDCPKPILLDLLSFDWVEDLGMAGIRYLEDRLERHEVTARIVENLSVGIPVDAVLKNHLDYCRRHGIEEVIPFAVAVIKDETRSNDVREIAVVTLGTSRKGLGQLRMLITDLKDEFRWYVLDKAKDLIPDDTRRRLKEILKDDPDDQKTKAAKLLVEMQETEGLDYLVSHVKNTKVAPQEYHEEAVFKKIIKPEAITPLMDLLEVTYDPDFKDNSSYSVQNVVLDALTGIAISHDRHGEIRERILALIKKKQPENDDVRYLHKYLMRLERNVWLNKSLNITLEDAIQQVDTVLHI
jgi:hypothetical protein